MQKGTTMSVSTISAESIKAIVEQAVKAVLAEQGFVVEAATTEAAPEKAEKAPFVKLTAEQKESRKAANRAAAAWMREKGLEPKGQAWDAVKNGERNVRKLQALNAADGVGVKAPKAEKVEVVAEVVAEPAKAAKAAKATTASKAPARARNAQGRFLPKATEAVTVDTEQALIEAVTTAGATEVPQDAEPGFTEQTLALMDSLLAQGLSDTEIVAAMAAAGITV